MTQQPTVIVAGASKGLGAELGRAFATSGYRVVLAARSAGPLDTLAAEIGPNAVAVTADLAEPSGVRRVVDIALESGTPPAVVINNAAIFGARVPLWEIEPETWLTVQRVNAFSAFLMLRAVLPLMLAARTGQIFGITSALQPSSLRHWGDYMPSKLAFLQVHQSAAADIGDASGVAIAWGSPGIVFTDIIREDLSLRPDERQRYLDADAAGRVRAPARVAAAFRDLVQRGIANGGVYPVNELDPPVSHDPSEGLIAQYLQQQGLHVDT